MGYRGPTRVPRRPETVHLDRHQHVRRAEPRRRDHLHGAVRRPGVRGRQLPVLVGPRPARTPEPHEPAAPAVYAEHAQRPCGRGPGRSGPGPIRSPLARARCCAVDATPDAGLDAIERTGIGTAVLPRERRPQSPRHDERPVVHPHRAISRTGGTSGPWWRSTEPVTPPPAGRGRSPSRRFAS